MSRLSGACRSLRQALQNATLSKACSTATSPRSRWLKQNQQHKSQVLTATPTIKHAHATAWFSARTLRERALEPMSTQRGHTHSEHAYKSIKTHGCSRCEGRPIHQGIPTPPPGQTPHHMEARTTSETKLKAPRFGLSQFTSPHLLCAARARGRHTWPSALSST